MNPKNKSLILTLFLSLVLISSTKGNITSRIEQFQQEASITDRLHQFIGRLVQTDSGSESFHQPTTLTSDRILGLNLDKIDLNELNAQMDESSSKSANEAYDLESMSSNSWRDQFENHSLKITKKARRLQEGSPEPYGSGYASLIKVEHQPAKKGGGGSKSAAASAAQARNPDCACAPVFTDHPTYPWFSLMGYEKAVAFSVLEKTLYHLYSFMKIGDSPFANTCSKELESIEVSVMGHSFEPRSSNDYDLTLNLQKDPIFTHKISRNEKGSLITDQSDVKQLLTLLTFPPKDVYEDDDLLQELGDTAGKYLEAFESMFRLRSDNSVEMGQNDFNRKLLGYMIRQTHKAVKNHGGNPQTKNLDFKSFAIQLSESGFHPFSSRFDMKWQVLIKGDKSKYGKTFLPLRLTGISNDKTTKTFDVHLVYTITPTVSSQGVQGYNVRAFVLDADKLGNEKISMTVSPDVSGSGFLRFSNPKVE